MKKYSLEEENTIQSLELSLGFVIAASDRVGLGKQARREGRKGTGDLLEDPDLARWEKSWERRVLVGAGIIPPQLT